MPVDSGMGARVGAWIWSTTCGGGWRAAMQAGESAEEEGWLALRVWVSRTDGRLRGACDDARARELESARDCILHHVGPWSARSRFHRKLQLTELPSPFSRPRAGLLLLLVVTRKDTNDRVLTTNRSKGFNLVPFKFQLFQMLLRIVARHQIHFFGALCAVLTAPFRYLHIQSLSTDKTAK